MTRNFQVAKSFEDKKINLPKRQTKYSAGYDFECSEKTTIRSIWKLFIEQFIHYINGDTTEKIKPTLVPTGVKAYMQPDEALFIYNRSGNPLKKGLILGNGVGVVDSDYFSNPDNDGHIMFQFYNFFPFDVTIEKGERIGQGVFQKFLKIDGDAADGKRISGHGHTGS